MRALEAMPAQFTTAFGAAVMQEELVRFGSKGSGPLAALAIVPSPVQP